MTRHCSLNSRRPHRRRSSILVIALALLAALVSRPSTGAPQGQLPNAPDRERTSGRDQLEDEDLAADGIELNWRVPARDGETRLETPWLEIEFRNVDPDPYDIQLRALEDAGSMQSRRIGSPLTAVIAGGESLVMQFPFADGVPAELTHSGMVVALVTACARDGIGRCTTGASAPLFFHPDRGGYVVYDEQLLCRRHSCGDLTGRTKREPGTWRVMGGGPLHGATSREEPEGDDDGIVDGGEI